MRLKLEKISEGFDEVIIRYRHMNATVQAVSQMVQSSGEKILASDDDGSQFILVDTILYFESIDGKNFAYTPNEVYQVNQTLKNLVYTYGKKGFFRSAKAMVLNIYHIANFKSHSFGRIEATLDNGEKVLISRKYALKLRQLLEEGVRDED